MKTVTIYTDGACSGNPGPGGWGAILMYGPHKRELSGGEAQKVALARALAQEPRLLLLDEPTSSLDPRNQHEVLRLVRHIARSRRICVVVILHDLNLAVRYCDRFLFLQGSRVYACGGPEVMTPETIQAVYGMRVQIIRHGGVPIVVPFPAETEEGAV